MRQALQRAWLRRGALAWLLWPLSLVFGAISAMRRIAYRAGWFKRERVGVPVIVVGNIIVGGSGKTPVVMALAEHLKARGIAAGVVSRGYGRYEMDCREVHPASHARDVGDEPLLIARTCAVPVFVAPKRADAARALLRAHPKTRVIICDDGLQHYALERDIEICVFDDRGTGNGWLLPAGPLRERWPRRVDLVLCPERTPGVTGYRVRRELAQGAMRADGMKRTLEDLRTDPALVAVAGIAKHDAFFDMLRARGLDLAQEIALPDHADYGDVAPALPDEVTLLCTEKDAVKLWKHRPDAWAVPLQLDIDKAFWTQLDKLLDAKLSSGHGSETA